ncbi:hypothetical protein [Microbacterium caowuchunii]|uniref:Uncharacterized protein n=1 Tax=Microbacterium caowuchunii TaxID=2614638 RepID=A0A5N0T6J9_9MICO|nr:hypothetical protein [Microbacterium caowuchunii]KAA9130388.1 hypothetical protein F6B40_14245 [Microbacterium caowuchunii]
MVALGTADVESLLYRHDPMGLAGAGAPADEYGPEASTIAPRLLRAASVDDVQRILVEEFTTWFGADITPDSSAFAAPATEIWDSLGR